MATTLKQLTHEALELSVQAKGKGKKTGKENQENSNRREIG